jgi:hypothetical protein
MGPFWIISTSIHSKNEKNKKVLNELLTDEDTFVYDEEK